MQSQRTRNEKSPRSTQPLNYGALSLICCGIIALASVGCDGNLDVNYEAGLDDDRHVGTQQEIANRPARLIGLHSPDIQSAAGIHEMNDVFAHRGGWMATAVYSTDYDWLGHAQGGSGMVGEFTRAHDAGFHNLARVDYVRGTTIPPQGTTSTCPVRQGSTSPARSAPDGTHLGCYLDYIEELARRADDAVNVWVIGNEMNLPDVEAQMFYEMGQGPIDPAWYVEVYEAARERIHSIEGHEEDLVLAAAVSPSKGCHNHNDPGQIPTCTTSGEDYLHQMLEYMSPERTDGFTLHAYGGYEELDDALQMFEDGNHARMGYREQLAMLDDYGFEQAPVIISEFSRHTHLGDIPEAHVTASFIRQAFEGIHNWNESGGHPVLGAVWYTWNQASFPTENLAGFDGILREAFRDIATREYPGQIPGSTDGSSGGDQQPDGAPAYCNDPGLDNCCDVPELGMTCETDQQWVDGWNCFYDICVEGAPPPQTDSGSDDSGSGGDSGSSDDSSQDDTPSYCSNPAYDNCCDVPELGMTCETDQQWVDGWNCFYDICVEGAPPPTGAGGDDPEPEPTPSFCSEPNKDNCCHVPPGTAEVPETHPGGICDPSGTGSYEDADWGAGFDCYQDACG